MRNNIPIPRWALWLMPSIIVRKSPDEKVLYLSFDDGPRPETTGKILEILHRYQAKASFFCTGTMVNKHPDLLEKIRCGGHSIGNHGMYHKKQGLFGYKKFISETDVAARLLNSRLFRPPYGFITPGVYRKLRQRYDIVLWDVMPGDFIDARDAASMMKTVKLSVRNGSIIVLHEKFQNSHNTLELLEIILRHYTALGFRFEGL